MQKEQDTARITKKLNDKENKSDYIINSRIPKENILGHMLCGVGKQRRMTNNFQHLNSISM